MKVQEYLEQLLAHMGLSGCSVEISEDDESITAKILVSEEDSGMMIGKHGETISSIQRLCSLTLNEKHDGKKIIVNVNDYLEKRKETLLTMAKRAADRAIETGRPVTLTRLKPSERRIVHMSLQENSEVVTQSEGEGMQRVLVVSPAPQKHDEE